MSEKKPCEKKLSATARDKSRGTGNPAEKRPPKKNVPKMRVADAIPNDELIFSFPNGRHNKLGMSLDSPIDFVENREDFYDGSKKSEPRPEEGSRL